MTEELKVVISAEMAKFASAMAEVLTALNNIQKELKETSSESEKSSEKTAKTFKEAFKEAKASADENFKKIGTTITTGMTKAATAVKDFAVKSVQAMKDFATKGAAVVSGAILALTEGTEEYRVNQAKLQSAFEQAGFAAEEASSIYNDLYKVIGDTDTSVEAAQQIALFTDSVDEAQQMAGLASGVLGTFGDALTPETFFEAANETLNLNEATGAYVQMLEGAGVNVENFNKQLQSLNTEEEKRNFILETADELMGEAGDAYDKHTEKIQKQREAQSKLQSNLAELGDAVAPVQTAFTNLANEALEKVMPYLMDLAEKYAPMIEPFFQNLAENVLPVLKDALKEAADYIGIVVSWVVDNWGILAAVAGVITGIAAAIGLYNVVGAIQAAMIAANVTTIGGLIAVKAAELGVWLASAAAMAVALLPYIAIVAAIAAVIAIIVLCVKHWDQIKEAVGKAWDWIKEKTKAAVEGVVNWFTQMKEKIAEKVQAMKDSVVEKFNAIKTNITDKINGAKTAVLNTFDNIKNGIKEKIEAAKNTVKSVIDAIKGFFNFKFSWPNIPMPHFGITPSGWKIGDLLKGSIPKLSINWYAEGGVFDKPTLFYGNGGLSGLGENGAEAVVPLEKNTQWLDRIAERLSGDGRNIILEVDGTTFGKVSCQSINQLTKQTGKLPIKVM